MKNAPNFRVPFYLALCIKISAESQLGNVPGIAEGILLCKSFRAVPFSGTELHDLRNFVGDAAGSMPVLYPVTLGC